MFAERDIMLQMSTAYELRVVLKDIKPPIWRVIRVPGNTTLHRLHQVIQAVMGWTNSHLYLFHVGEADFGEPDPEWEQEVMDSTRTSLERIVRSGVRSFVYEYDMGDSWEHQITIQKTLEDDRNETQPVCLEGARACPPEDCGGPYGYPDFLEAISDPNHEEHEETLEWAGGHFDPEEFDLDAVNKALASLRVRRPKASRR